MKALALLATLMLATLLPAPAAEPDTRVFEMRTYHTAPGKMEALHKRFRDHTLGLFQKHAITSLGYWVPLENADNKLVFVLAYPSRDAREASWKAFMGDPIWQKAFAESEEAGKLVTKVDQLFMTATDFSPAVTGVPGKEQRVFELRTYTTTPGNLPLLHARFRDHTCGLFAKHGMTNLWYWQLAKDQPGTENTLIYFLAHASTDAAKASFGGFRTDADWNAAKAASEAKGGGSLTVPDGVKSVFMRATDYSPLQ